MTAVQNGESTVFETGRFVRDFSNFKLIRKHVARKQNFQYHETCPIVNPTGKKPQIEVSSTYKKKTRNNKTARFVYEFRRTIYKPQPDYKWNIEETGRNLIDRIKADLGSETRCSAVWVEKAEIAEIASLEPRLYIVLYVEIQSLGVPLEIYLKRTNWNKDEKRSIFMQSLEVAVLNYTRQNWLTTHSDDLKSTPMFLVSNEKLLLDEKIMVEYHLKELFCGVMVNNGKLNFDYKWHSKEQKRQKVDEIYNCVMKLINPAQYSWQEISEATEIIVRIEKSTDARELLKQIKERRITENEKSHKLSISVYLSGLESDMGSEVAKESLSMKYEMVPFTWQDILCGILLMLYGSVHKDIGRTIKFRKNDKNNNQRKEIMALLDIKHAPLFFRMFNCNLDVLALGSLWQELNNERQYGKLKSYTEARYLSRGSYGIVYEAKHLGSGQVYAVKLIDIDKTLAFSNNKTLTEILNSLEVPFSLNHHYILKYKDLFLSKLPNYWPDPKRNEEYSEEMCSSTPESTNKKAETNYNTALSDNPLIKTGPQYIYIVMEACKCSLADRLSSPSFKQESVFKYMQHFANGLMYLNWNGYMHRDIKPGNALITYQDRLVISDLDTLAITSNSDKDDDCALSRIGTHYYAAPEVYTGKYNYQADYHSLGYSFFQMLYPKFSLNQIEEMVKNLHKGEQPPNMDAKTAFILYWLTNPEILNRANKDKIMFITKYFDPKSYSEWEICEEQAHWILLDLKKLVPRKNFIICTRVARKHDVLRKVLGRLPNDMFSRVVRHEEAEVIESIPRRDGVCRNKAEKKLMLDVVDGYVTLVPAEKDYVYVCKEQLKVLTTGSEYDIVSFLDKATPMADPGYRYMMHLSNRNMCIDYLPKYITSEGICLYLATDFIQKLPEEYAHYEFTRFYRLDEINDDTDVNRSCNVFSLGLYLFWLVSLEFQLEERLEGLKELKAGKLPKLLEKPFPHYVEKRKNEYRLMLTWLCNANKFNRPIPEMLDKINHENPILSVPSTAVPFLMHQFSDYTTSKRFLAITTSSRPEIVDLVWTKLGMFPDVELFPNKLLTKSGFHLSAEKEHEELNVRTEGMLEVAENGKVRVVPRANDAVTFGVRIRHTIDLSWTAKNLGTELKVAEYISDDQYIDRLHYLLIRPIERIYCFFYSQIRVLARYHEHGVFHGNLKLVKIRDEPDCQLWCIDLPALVTEDSEMFTRESYITDVTSLEQKENLNASVASDIYSVGALLLKVFCIILDIPAENVGDILASKDYTGMELVPNLFFDLILEMTADDPKSRPSLQIVLEKMKEIRSTWLDPTYHKYRKHLKKNISSEFMKIVVSHSQKPINSP